jgi:hypothetical protein
MYWIRRSTGATLFVPGNWLWVIALIQNGARAALASLAQCCEWLILSAFGASRFFKPLIIERAVITASSRVPTTVLSFGNPFPGG